MSAFLNMLLPGAAKMHPGYVMFVRILQGLVEVSLNLNKYRRNRIYNIKYSDNHTKIYENMESKLMLCSDYLSIYYITGRHISCVSRNMASLGATIGEKSFGDTGLLWSVFITLMHFSFNGILFLCKTPNNS